MSASRTPKAAMRSASCVSLSVVTWNVPTAKAYPCAEASAIVSSRQGETKIAAWIIWGAAASEARRRFGWLLACEEQGESGVALRLPPHSINGFDRQFRRTQRFLLPCRAIRPGIAYSNVRFVKQQAAERLQEPA